MEKTFTLVQIDYKYCNYLRKYDYRVPYNAGKKILRPFIGVLFKVDGKEYFAPLSSPKPKHKSIKNKIDIIKIQGGELGVININNMIPVRKNNYKEIDLKQLHDTDVKYWNLLFTQLIWLNKKFDYIHYKCINLYSKYINGDLSYTVKNRCCNFPLLEEKCLEYKEEVPN